MSNLFTEARAIIRGKGMVDLTDEERHTVGAAMIVVNHSACPYPDDILVQDVLEHLGQELNGAEGKC